jgi:hypothetical protein
MLNLSNPETRKKTTLSFLTLVIVLLVFLGACTGSAEPAPTAALPPTATTDLIIEPTAGIAATVTAVAKLPPLSSDQAAAYLEVRELVLACPEFHPNRQITLLRHLEWLTNPNQVPPEFITLYGDNVSGQLVFGAAYTVAVEWKTGGRQASSCLIPIGDRLNVILVELGRQPVPEFATP